MKIYARIDNGVVVEIIASALWPEELPNIGGKEIPIEHRFTREFVATLVDITDASPQPDSGWTAVDGGKTFSPPALQ